MRRTSATATAIGIAARAGTEEETAAGAGAGAEEVVRGIRRKNGTTTIGKGKLSLAREATAPVPRRVTQT